MGGRGPSTWSLFICFPRHIRIEVEQPVLELVLIWDADATGSGLTHCTSVQTFFTLVTEDKWVLLKDFFFKTRKQKSEGVKLGLESRYIMISYGNS